MLASALLVTDTGYTSLLFRGQTQILAGKQRSLQTFVTRHATFSPLNMDSGYTVHFSCKFTRPTDLNAQTVMLVPLVFKLLRCGISIGSSHVA